MHIQSTPDNLTRYRRTAHTFFQRTFHTPLKELPAFVAILLAGDPPLASASVTVDQVVFTPKHLDSLLVGHKLTLENYHGRTITADGPQESQALLVAALGDWVDFLFVPEPTRFLLYADHDEYTTLFAARKGTLSRLASAMAASSFAEVADYERTL